MRIAHVDLDQEVLVIAEVGNNHEGDCDLAERMIGMAAQAGAQAVKFQTIVPERLVSPAEPERIRQLQRFSLTQDQFQRLARAAEREGILFLSTPFDLESVGFLDSLMPAFKIASGDNDFAPLLERVAETGKPVLLSTGLCDLAAVQRAKSILEETWQERGLAGEVVLLHCVTSYPTPPQEANLLALHELQRLGTTVGYSDHTLGIEAAVLSVALGARVVEKHFTLDKNHSTFHDHKLSADPAELKELTRRVREAQQFLGSGAKHVLACEQSCALRARRSIVASRDLPEGTPLTMEHLEWLRPGGGLSPLETRALLGRVLARSLSRGEMIMFKDIR